MTFALVFILSLLNSFVILPLLGIQGNAALALGWMIGFGNGLLGLWIYRTSLIRTTKNGIQLFFIRSALKFFVIVSFTAWLICHQGIPLKPFICSLFIAYFTFLFYYVVTLKGHTTT